MTGFSEHCKLKPGSMLPCKQSLDVAIAQLRDEVL